MASIVIVGAGPNLGAAVARRFGREGLAVGLVPRSAEKLETLAGELSGEGLTVASRAADIRDADALTGAIAALAEELGAVEVLSFSPLPAKEVMKPILETTADEVALGALRTGLLAQAKPGRLAVLPLAGIARVVGQPHRAETAHQVGAPVGRCKLHI